jgi:GPH family glycoside/pentoside/hexuronide:cation symporter
MAVTTYIIGVVMVGSLQMYVYVHFMQLSSDQKVVVHGMGMVSGGVGALLAPFISRRLDKKPAALLGIGASIASNILMWLVFLTGGMPVDYAVGVGGLTVPVAVLSFMACQGLFWGGNAILQPISYSMIADVSQVHQHNTGVLRDGSYSAMLSLVYKVSIAMGIAVSGFAISGIGYRAELSVQSPAVITRLMQAMCIGGGSIPFIAALILWRYPINREFMERIGLQEPKTRA